MWLREPTQQQHKAACELRVAGISVSQIQMSQVSLQTALQASLLTSVTMERLRALMFIVSSTISAAKAGV